MANSRILVEEPIFDAFCERFVAVAKSLKVGDPREPDTLIGPLIRGTQCAVIDSHVEDAVGKGAKLLCGATHEAQYYWPTPTTRITASPPASSPMTCRKRGSSPSASTPAMVHLNDCTVSDEPHAPFGGVKNSGFGREGGRFSMEEMTELKWITIQSGQRAFPM
jgi:vanillin dehydrogenase